MMSRTVSQLIAELNPTRPYVWEMKITEHEFGELQTYVSAHTSIAEETEARAAVIYIAEWYKRCYDGSSVKTPEIDLQGRYERIFSLSRIDERYLYKGTSVNLYFQSMLVLGGLACQKNYSDRLLKTLCRIFRGELDDFAQKILESNNDAIAFRESISGFGSLYAYLQKILAGEVRDVYSSDDLKDTESPINSLLQNIYSAYDEVLADKFELEWIVDRNPGTQTLHRALRLWLKPERSEGYREILGFDRCTTKRWEQLGDIKKCRRLEVILKFISQSEEILQTSPVLYFENTGQEDSGFVATGSRNYAMLKEVPVKDFDSVEVIVRADNGKEAMVQSFTYTGYCQIWQTSDNPFRWSSRQRPHAPTVVIFNDKWNLEETAPDAIMTWRSRIYGIGDILRWKSIVDKAVLSDGHKIVTLWNREGYIRISSDLYNSILLYTDGKVLHRFKIDAEEDEEPDGEELLPCIFSIKDINVCQFKVRDDWDLSDKAEQLEPEKIEFRTSGARNFTPLEEGVSMPYGIIDIRLTIRGQYHTLTVAYLPTINSASPIERDLESHLIRYRRYDGSISTSQIQIPESGPVQSPTEIVQYGSSDDLIEVNVILPITIKEVWIDGVFAHRFNEAQYSIPYILKSRAFIKDFSQSGYQEYNCEGLSGFFNDIKASLALWEKGYNRKAKDLDAYAPEGLNVTLGDSKKEEAAGTFVYWDYSSAVDAKEVGHDFEEMADYSLVFQDQRPPKINCALPRVNDDPWSEPKGMNAKDCFLKAVKYKTYFFIFNPLTSIEEKEFMTEIYNSFKDNAEYTPHLFRLAEELNFNIKKPKHN